MISLYRICLVFAVINIGQSFIFNDTQNVSQLIFLDRTHLKLVFNQNKSIDVLLKPYSKSTELYDKNIDDKCLMTGDVIYRSDKIGSAVISICLPTIRGIFYMLDGNSYLLNESERNHINGQRKRMKRFSPDFVISRVLQNSEEDSLCGNIFDVEDEISGRASDYKNVTDVAEIYMGKATIKVAFYIDQMLFKHRFQSKMIEAKRFVAIHAGYLQKQMQQKNLLKFIEMDLVVVHFGIAPFYDTHEWHIKRYLNQFCNWTQNDKSAVYGDVNILLAGSTQWWINPSSNELSTSIKGLAYVGTTCARMSCIAVEAHIGYKSTRVLVHEFGHNLGADHDGKVKFQTQECNPDSYIMSWAVSSGKVTWSDCSAKHMRLYLQTKERDDDTQRIKCLSKDAKPVDSSLDTKNNDLLMPGLKMSADKQCRLAFGPNYSQYKKDLNNVCLNLECKSNLFIVSSRYGAFEGTYCGLNRRCELDKCRRIPLEDLDSYVDEQMGVSKTYFGAVYSNFTFL